MNSRICRSRLVIGRRGFSTPGCPACGVGGLSGAPLKERSLEVLTRLRQAAGPELALISVGGVETADDVVRRLDAGATLVQGYTAFLYEGPFWASSINRALKNRLPLAR